MTVAELIDKLTKVNPEAEVVFYNSCTEDDGRANIVEEYRLEDYTENHYCQGDTVVDFVAGDAEDFYTYRKEEYYKEDYDVIDGINPKYRDIPIVVIKNW